MSERILRPGPRNTRRTALVSFYCTALLAAVATGFAWKSQSLQRIVLPIALVAAVAAIWFLLRFLRSNDERERLINYEALSFAFVGTLVFSFFVGFLQSFGFHAVSWVGIPALMITLWSIGLILCSWRYR